MLAAAAAAAAAATGAGPGEPSQGRRAELKQLVVQECGSCHGLRLTGGLGSPLTAARAAPRPSQVLAAVIGSGRPGTAMPGWNAFITETEIDWIVAQLLAGAFVDER